MVSHHTELASNSENRGIEGACGPHCSAVSAKLELLQTQDASQCNNYGQPRESVNVLMPVEMPAGEHSQNTLNSKGEQSHSPESSLVGCAAHLIQAQAMLPSFADYVQR